MTNHEFATALARAFHDIRPECSRKHMREFRHWSAIRDNVALLVEEHLGMNAGTWSGLCEPTEDEVWARRKRKLPRD